MSVSPAHCAKKASASLPVEKIRHFARYLREHGFLVGFGELDAMLRMAMMIDITQHKILNACWRGIVCSNPVQWHKYTDLFDAFWYPHKVRGSTRMASTQKKTTSLKQRVEQMHADMDVPTDAAKPSVGLDFNGSSGDGVESPKAMGGASKADPLHQDFKKWLPEDVAQLESLIAPLEQRLRKKLLRKWRPTHQTQRIDLPSMIRQGLSTGGELIKLKRKQRDEIMPRFYVLVDVSKSMESHAPFFLRIGRALSRIVGARVFVFHTRLAEITPLLHRNSGRVQEKINAVTFGFGGGTKIASNLSTFLNVHVGRALGARDLVYVLSDGYDTDPPDETERSIRAIRQRGAKLYWLHPNKEEPGSQAIQQSRHLISGFLAIHHLQSLENLVKLV